jgi:hypothetical protein
MPRDRVVVKGIDVVWCRPKRHMRAKPPSSVREELLSDAKVGFVDVLVEEGVEGVEGVELVGSRSEIPSQGLPA